VADLLNGAAELGDGEPALLLDWPICVQAVCIECRQKWHPMRRLGWLRRWGRCPACGSSRVREEETLARISRDNVWATAELAQLGLPADHLHTIRFEKPAEGGRHQEWELLQRLSERNPGVVESVGRQRLADGEVFEVVLHETAGIVGWRGVDAVIERSHRAVFRYPRFFPAVPIEVTLTPPVFHPNVDPVMGLVRLWERTSPGDSIPEAVQRLQRMVSWADVNYSPEHVLQPEAVRWGQERGVGAGLGFTPIKSAP